MPKVADRVRETSTTEGTGDLTLDGPLERHQGFVAAIGASEQCYYWILHRTVDQWEYGIGTVLDSPDRLQRDTVLGGSDGTSPVDLAAGPKDVYVSVPSARLPLLGADGKLLPGQRPDYAASDLTDVNVGGASDGQFLRRVSGIWAPHSLVKGDVGLGNVDNYATATQAEAEAGTLNDRFMTPLRTAQAIDELVVVPPPSMVLNAHPFSPGFNEAEWVLEDDLVLASNSNAEQTWSGFPNSTRQVVVHFSIHISLSGSLSLTGLGFQGGRCYRWGNNTNISTASWSSVFSGSLTQDTNNQIHMLGYVYLYKLGSESITYRFEILRRTGGATTNFDFVSGFGAQNTPAFLNGFGLNPTFTMLAGSRFIVHRTDD